VLGAFSLLAWRLDRLRAQGGLDSIVSRESPFLLNNLFLIAAAFTVFFGTVFPLLSEAVKGVKVSVGAPFFNLVNIPIFLALIFLMGVGPLIAWRSASAENLKRNFLKPVVIGIAWRWRRRASHGPLRVLLDRRRLPPGQPSAPLTRPLTTPPVPGPGSPQEPDQSRAVSAPGRAPGPAARRRWGLSGGSWMPAASGRVMRTGVNVAYGLWADGQRAAESAAR
jgi:hypothetical protein